jgi:iron complex transport system ATP-binding protein
VDLSIERGQCWGVVGPNGAGKSTLLRVMAAMRRPSSGSIAIEGVPVRRMSTRRLARTVAFVPQQIEATGGDYSAEQVVLLGRFPHRRFSLFESAEDQRIALDAMERTGIARFAERPLRTLSGGEAQRVHIAAALAQQPRVLLLDEPTSSLDIQHQILVFTLLCRIAAEGMAVVVACHDLNLTLRFCTHAMLLSDGAVAASGAPGEVITPDLLEPVYHVRMEYLTGAGAESRPWIAATEARR